MKSEIKRSREISSLIYWYFVRFSFCCLYEFSCFSLDFIPPYTIARWKQQKSLNLAPTICMSTCFWMSPFSFCATNAQLIIHDNRIKARSKYCLNKIPLNMCRHSYFPLIQSHGKPISMEPAWKSCFICMPSINMLLSRCWYHQEASIFPISSILNSKTGKWTLGWHKTSRKTQTNKQQVAVRPSQLCGGQPLLRSLIATEIDVAVNSLCFYFWL